MDTMAARDLHPALERNTRVTCCCCCCCCKAFHASHGCDGTSNHASRITWLRSQNQQHRDVAACSVAGLLRNVKQLPLMLCTSSALAL